MKNEKHGEIINRMKEKLECQFIHKIKQPMIEAKVKAMMRF